MKKIIEMFRLTSFIWIPIVIVFVMLSLTTLVPKKKYKYAIIDDLKQDTFQIIEGNIEEIMLKLNITSFDTSGYTLLYVGQSK